MKLGKIIKWTFLTLAVAIATFSVVVAMQSSDFHIERSATMDVTPAAAFAQVNDFHNWQEWSPWAKLDPNSKATFEGPASGEGAIFRWEGNSEVGKGSMTIVESRPNEHIKIKLEFFEPMEATNYALFTFKPVSTGSGTSESDKTTVTWAMDGKKNFLCKAVHMCMDMDKMLGDYFEKGLAQMQLQAQKASSSTGIVSKPEEK